MYACFSGDFYPDEGFANRKCVDLEKSSEIQFLVVCSILNPLPVIKFSDVKSLLM